jgi:hypothetical protein
MSYRAESTISQECEWGLPESMWKDMCSILGIRLINIFIAFTPPDLPELFHGTFKVVLGV